MPISDFQSEFSMSKIIRIFLIFFFIEECQFMGTLVDIEIFKKGYPSKNANNKICAPVIDILK